LPYACYKISLINPPSSGSSGTTTTTNTGTGAGGTTSTPTKTGNTGNNTGATTTTSTSKTSPSTSHTQSSTTVTNVITNNRNVLKSPSSIGAVAAAAPSQITNSNNNNFLTYLNTPDKITIRYPSTWTKTEFANNPSIPVIFNAPINGTTAATTRTTLMINVNQLTPSSATPDAYTQQQINALTNSSVIKYAITDTNSKVLTPPAGITAYREISYNGIKNSTVSSNNNVPTQIPLKGTAIFFVNGNTGYTLLYLAKQSEYSQNLPTVQQMINTFQMNATGGVDSGSGLTGGSSNGG
jgi:hypothetical protein